MTAKTKFRLVLATPIVQSVPAKIEPQVIAGTETSHCLLWKGLFDPAYYDLLLAEITDWPQDKPVVYGKQHIMARCVTAQGNPGISYRFSGQSIGAKSWTPTILEIKQKVEEVTGSKYNFVLLNKYPAKAYLGWHSDSEKDIVNGATIASVSLGVRRDFQVRREYPGGKVGPIIPIPLGAGDLLTMEGAFQSEYKHCVPKRAKVEGMRINLTFRLMH